MALRCAVFASGSGSNFEALLNRKESGDLHADFAVCVGNNSKAFAFERARRRGIETVHCPPSKFPSEESHAALLLKILGERGIELIILAGYMKKLPAAVIREYRLRIVNIHPGLLPGFGGKGMYGHHVHEAVLRYGAKVSGITVHFVDEEYDHGPVILQATTPVSDSDTADSLAARVLELEHANYWRAIEAISRKSLTVSGRLVTGMST